MSKSSRTKRRILSAGVGVAAVTALAGLACGNPVEPRCPPPGCVDAPPADADPRDADPHDATEIDAGVDAAIDAAVDPAKP